MDPASVTSRLLTEGVMITALVTMGLMIMTTIGYVSIGVGARRLVVVMVMLLFGAAILATTAKLFPDAVKSAYDYINRIGYQR